MMRLGCFCRGMESVMTGRRVVQSHSPIEPVALPCQRNQLVTDIVQLCISRELCRVATKLFSPRLDSMQYVFTKTLQLFCEP